MELSICLTIDDVKSIGKCVTLDVHNKHYLIEVSVKSKSTNSRKGRERDLSKEKNTRKEKKGNGVNKIK